MLNDKSIDKILCIGRFKYDVAARLEYAKINKKKIVLVEDLNNIVNTILNDTKGDIYTMVCFDMTAILKSKIKEASNENN